MGEFADDRQYPKSPASRLTPLQKNARDLEQELAWFAQVLDTRFKLYFKQKAEYEDIFAITPPDLSCSDSPYARFIHQYHFALAERLAIILCLAPHLRPQILDIFFTKNKIFDRRFIEFGGALQGSEGDFLPTIETLAFLIAGNDLETRFALQSLFTREHVFAKHNILHLYMSGYDDSLMKAPLQLSDEYLCYLTTGQANRPDFGVNFPAQFIETQLDWDNLVLHPGTHKQIEEIASWVRHGETLMKDWGMSTMLRPGYRSLFYGPPGTGKTMTACLLGKSTNREVYKVDLSLVISKYIGETEKNLAKVFDQAQYKGWILFFDEADALFGKRSETKDSHDRYANQEVSFLLQRIEMFDGIAILASNRKENLDEAFARRFESIIYFPPPRTEERLRLWQQGFSSKAELAADVDLEKIAKEHSLTGGAIMNVIRYASLQTLEHGSRVVRLDDIVQGIRKEFIKNGKSG